MSNSFEYTRPIGDARDLSNPSAAADRSPVSPHTDAGADSQSGLVNEAMGVRDKLYDPQRPEPDRSGGLSLRVAAGVIKLNEDLFGHRDERPDVQGSASSPRPEGVDDHTGLKSQEDGLGPGPARTSSPEKAEEKAIKARGNEGDEVLGAEADGYMSVVNEAPGSGRDTSQTDQPGEPVLAAGGEDTDTTKGRMTSEADLGDPSEIHKTISSAAEKAYADFTQDNPDIPETANPWELPYCFDIAPRLQTYLAEKGIETTVIRGGGGEVDDIHDYLVTSDGLIIDPTWQQHLDPALRSESDLPRVLLVHQEKLRQVLSGYQIPDGVQARWQVQDFPLPSADPPTSAADGPAMPPTDKPPAPPSSPEEEPPNDREAALRGVVNKLSLSYDLGDSGLRAGQDPAKREIIARQSYEATTRTRGEVVDFDELPPEQKDPSDEEFATIIAVKLPAETPGPEGTMDMLDEDGSPQTSQRQWRPGELRPALIRAVGILDEHGIDVNEIFRTSPTIRKYLPHLLDPDKTNQEISDELGAPVFTAPQNAARAMDKIQRAVPAEIRDLLPGPTGSVRGELTETSGKVGPRLKAIFREAGITQEELAKRLDASDASVSRLLGGRIHPPISKVGVLVSNALQEDLITQEEAMRLLQDYHSERSKRLKGPDSTPTELPENVKSYATPPPRLHFEGDETKQPVVNAFQEQLRTNPEKFRRALDVLSYSWIEHETLEVPQTEEDKSAHSAIAALLENGLDRRLEYDDTTTGIFDNNTHVQELIHAHRNAPDRQTQERITRELRLLYLRAYIDRVIRYRILS